MMTMHKLLGIFNAFLIMLPGSARVLFEDERGKSYLAVKAGGLYNLQTRSRTSVFEEDCAIQMERHSPAWAHSGKTVVWLSRFSPGVFPRVKMVN